MDPGLRRDRGSGSHAASALSPRRSTWVIWPRIETAISAGDTAPIAEPDRAVDARQIGCRRSPVRCSRSQRAGMGAPRAERADVEALRAQRHGERRVVELRVVGQRHDRRARGRASAAPAPRPAIRCVSSTPGKPRFGRQGAARIDDDQPVVGRDQHLHQRLRDMHRADHEAAPRRAEHLDEDAPLRRLEGRVAVGCATPRAPRSSAASSSARSPSIASPSSNSCAPVCSSVASATERPLARRRRSPRRGKRPFIRRARQRSRSCRRRRGRLPRPARR